jgi:hypothetical protein
MVIGEFCYFGVATGLQMLRRTIGSALHNFEDFQTADQYRWFAPI